MFFAGGLEKGLFPAGYQKKAGIRNGELDGTGHGLDPLKQLFALVAEALRGHDGCHLGRDLILALPAALSQDRESSPREKTRFTREEPGSAKALT